MLLPVLPRQGKPVDPVRLHPLFGKIAVLLSPSPEGCLIRILIFASTNVLEVFAIAKAGQNHITYLFGFLQWLLQNGFGPDTLVMSGPNNKITGRVIWENPGGLSQRR